MVKDDRYRKGDIVTFLSNQPRIHLLEMSGNEKFNPEDIEESRYTGVITDVHETPIGTFHTLTTLKPVDGFLCIPIHENKIIDKYMFKILWIHGFGGRPDNDKVKEMRRSYPMYEFHSIEVDHHAKASMNKINAYIREQGIDLVAGTSLGGYYAMCSEFDGPKLVVNPVTDPVRDLRKFLGPNTYKPGRPDGQTDFIFTEEMLNEFGELVLQPLDRVVCHHTPHDQLLGEAIKEDYARMFTQRQEMEEAVLPNHFLSFRYVKSSFGETLKNIFEKTGEKYLS